MCSELTSSSLFYNHSRINNCRKFPTQAKAGGALCGFSCGVNNALVITLEPGNSGDDGIGIDEVIRTWTNDKEWGAIALPSEPSKTKEADIYGTIVAIDSSNSDQQIALINYPDEQVYGEIYISTTKQCFKIKKFIRGDVDYDTVGDRKVTIGDAIRILEYMFKGGVEPPCLDAADADDNGKIGLTDAVRILSYLFQGGKAPESPYPDAGIDPTEDELSCDAGIIE